MTQHYSPEAQEELPRQLTSERIVVHPGALGATAALGNARACETLFPCLAGGPTSGKSPAKGAARLCVPGQRALCCPQPAFFSVPAERVSGTRARRERVANNKRQPHGTHTTTSALEARSFFIILFVLFFRSAGLSFTSSPSGKVARCIHEMKDT